MSLEKPGAFTLPYSQKYKKSSAYDFPKFVLNKKDEKAIIMVIDPEPTCAFLHWIMTGTRIDNRTKTTVFSGSYFICTGKPETLLREERDEENCIFCKQAEDIEDAPVGIARFKACSHIIHYATTPAGVFSAISGHPPMFNLEVWVFGQQVYNSLVDKKNTWGEYTYRHHDIQITCVSPQYRNYQLDVLPQAVWLEAQYTKFNKDTKKPESGLAVMVVTMYQQGKLKDLASILGKLVSADEAEKLASKAKSVVSETTLIGQGQTPDQVETGVNAGMPQQQAQNIPNIYDLFGGSKPPSPSAETPMEARSTPPTTPLPQTDHITQPTDTGEIDFDALMNS